MKIGRARYKNDEFYFVRKGEHAIKIAPPFGKIYYKNEEFHLGDLEFLVPCTPTKIVAVGLNYRNHGDEIGMKQQDHPIIFLKPPSALLAHNGTIILPFQSEKVDYEAELGIVISKPCKNVSAEDAKDFILGYTCVNDCTARDLQALDTQWTRAKSFDTFAPVGPWIETRLDPNNLNIKAILDGETVQSDSTSSMICPPFELVSYISRVMTLYPGDVISTGTPCGVGKMETGQKIEIEIEGIGKLVNMCE